MTNNVTNIKRTAVFDEHFETFFLLYSVANTGEQEDVTEDFYQLFGLYETTKCSL